METRHSSPSSRVSRARPRTHRKRSNSVPIVDALGCSTPEAELILAEGRAAVHRRHPSRQRRGRRGRTASDESTSFRPQDHMRYLNGERETEEEVQEPIPTDTRPTRHSRLLSTSTDRSGSTVTGPAAPPLETPESPEPSARPLGDYSANLAQFIKSQLSSIPSYHPIPHALPRSCPELPTQTRRPPLSPAQSLKRSFEIPSVLQMPAIRPPLRSQFSAWSSTDDDEIEDEVPPLPSIDQPKDSKASDYTPSLLRYYESTDDASFLLSSTPLEERAKHPNADGFSFPQHSAQPVTASETQSPSRDDHDYPSSTLSTRPQLTSSSAPSISSTSTGSYFDCKRPLSIAPNIRDRIIAAVSPHPNNGKIVHAISPYENGSLANVHDIFIESQHRVCVDGLSFDLLRDFNMPSSSTVHRALTPC